MSYTETLNIPTKFQSRITKNDEGTNSERILITGITDIFNSGYAGFYLKTDMGEGFLIDCFKGSGCYIIDQGLTVGGNINGIKRIYTNGNATCILKQDNSVVHFYGTKINHSPRSCNKYLRPGQDLPIDASTSPLTFAISQTLILLLCLTVTTFTNIWHF